MLIELSDKLLKDSWSCNVVDISYEILRLLFHLSQKPIETRNAMCNFSLYNDDKEINEIVVKDVFEIEEDEICESPSELSDWSDDDNSQHSDQLDEHEHEHENRYDDDKSIK